jgi:hypothetical protein
MRAEWVGIVVSGLLALAALIVSILNRRATTATLKEGNRRTGQGSAIAQRALELAERQASRYMPPWTVEHDSGQRYRLVNAGDEIAHDVTISGSNVHREPIEQEVLHPGGAFDFLLAQTFDNPDNSIVVTWHRKPGKSDEQQTWQSSVPASQARRNR